MIYRIHKNKNYSIIHNSVLNEKSLSWKAKGILAYLLSKPDGWEVKERDIVKQGKDGKDSVSSGVKELIQAGYVKRKRWQDESGHWHWMTDVFETPQPCGKSELGKSDIGKSELGKPAFIVNTELVNTELVNTELVCEGQSENFEKNKGEILPLNAEKNEPPKVAANPPKSYEQQHKELMEIIMKEIPPSAQKAYLDSVGHRMTTKEFNTMVAEMVDHYFEDYGFKKNPQGFIKRKLRTFISNRKSKAARKKPKSNALARGEYRNPPRVEEMNRMKKSRQIL